jgi:DnaJ like chaperone protein
MIIYSAALLLLIYILFKIFTTFSERIACAFSGINSSETQRHDIQELFFRTVFTLLGYVAKRDGAINYLEVRYTESYMEKMNLDSAHKREAIRLFKLGAEPKFRADKTIKQFQWLAQKSPNLAQILLSYLINIARADGFLVNKEIEAVEKVALGLGYSTITFRHLLRMLSVKNQPCDPIISLQCITLRQRCSD